MLPESNPCYKSTYIVRNNELVIFTKLDDAIAFLPAGHYAPFVSTTLLLIFLLQLRMANRPQCSFCVYLKRLGNWPLASLTPVYRCKDWLPW